MTSTFLAGHPFGTSITEETLRQQFAPLNQWEDKYRQLILLGKQLPPLPADLKQDNIEIAGCENRVWLGHTRQADGTLQKLYQQDDATRAANFARMQQVLAEVEARVPGASRATDSAGRECDIAIDHSEFTQLSDAQIDKIVLAMRHEGMHATVSSIHVNGWYGDHNKLEGARWIVRELWGRRLDDEIDRWAYVGDSTNDQLMFQAFPHSIGVANIARFVPHLSQLPRYVTPSERGAGFVEVARAILAAR